MLANTGEFNVYVTFQIRDPSSDSFGQQGSWDYCFATYARVIDLTGTILYQGGAFSAQAIHKVTIPYPLGVIVASNMRVSFSDRTFLIRSVANPFQRNIQLDIFCEEITGAE